jgi:hypothetical protein
MGNDLLFWPSQQQVRAKTPREIGRERRVKALGTVLDSEFASLLETIYACETQAKRLPRTWSS